MPKLTNMTVKPQTGKFRVHPQKCTNYHTRHDVGEVAEGEELEKIF